MSDGQKILIISPLTPIESSRIKDIVNGHTMLLVLRGFLHNNTMRAISRDVLNCHDNITTSNYINANLTTLGPYLARYLSNPHEYFSKSQALESIYPQSLIDMRANIYETLRRELVLNCLKTAFEPGSGNYSGSIIRFHADGISNPLHTDNILRDGSGSGLAVAAIKHQLSCVVCLQECTQGGRLRIHQKTWEPSHERFKVKGELGYREDVISGSNACDYYPRRGDIYVFNPNHYHQILAVSGTTRITMGFFLGIVDDDMKKAIAWS